MTDTELILPQFAWISCRETDHDSRELGDVVVPGVVVRERSDMLGKTLGEISHGSKVLVNETVGAYSKVSFNELNGWIQSVFVAWSWSTFSFFGKLRPLGACKALDISISSSGFELIIKEDNFALVTEGDPGHFDIIKRSAINVMSRLLQAQALITAIPLSIEFTNWVEMSTNESKQSKTVGFMFGADKTDLTITSSDIQNAYSIANLTKYSPYFDLALSDYYQAIKHPQHALIFLARAIESLENSFAHLAQKGKGKEEVLREILGVAKSDVEYVTKRANESHMRHASRDAKVKDVPQDEMLKCFSKTSKLLASYASYLQSLGPR
jgi:hypothetical protein